MLPTFQEVALMKGRLFFAAALLFVSTSARAEAPLPEVDSGIRFKMKGITLNFGGFLEGAGIYRSRNLDSDIASPFQSLPLGNTAGYYQDETRFTARHSRLTLLVRGDYRSDTHFAGYYEADFLGAAPTANSNESNSYNLRMRHAYATVDWSRLGLHLLAGQNWSLSTMNREGILPRQEAIPFTIDSQYIPGFTWTRQPQFRIVKDWDKKYWLGLSVENPQSTVRSGPNAPINTNFANAQPPGNNFANTLSVNAFPDFVVKAAADPGWGHFEIFDLIRVFESGLAANGRVNTTFRVTNAVGGGAILPLVGKELKLYLSGMYGDGIGRYGSAQLPDLTQSELGENIPLESSKLLAGLGWEPTPEWQLYAYYGQERVEKKSWVDTTTGKGYGYGSELYDNSGASVLGGTVNGNIKKIWQVTTGGWWKFYQGDMGRMQAGLQYSYTEDEYFHVNKGGAVEANDNMVFASLRYYWE
jgi:hypothetical protein